jgi:MFS-type transporter involved in bile tolerance (Atg22 family)
VKEEELTKAKINAKEYIVSLKDGFTYLKENAVLRYFVVLAVFLNAVLVPYNSLQAPLISEVLHSGEIMLSVLGVAIAIGMIFGAAVYPYLSNKLNQRIIASLGGYSIGVFYLMFVVLGRFVVSVIATYIIVSLVSFIVGVAVALLSSFCNVEFVKNIQGDYIARVSSIFSACCVAAVPVVSFIISILAGFTPTIVLFLVAGILDFIICFSLCSKKRFVAMKKEEAEGNNGEKIADSTAC